MKTLKPALGLAISLSTILSQSTFGSNMSPECWPVQARSEAERRQALSWMPEKAAVISGANQAIAACASPIAVQAGMQCLLGGGNAADAAATVALTQVSTELGSVVSYAGVMSLVYYDADSKKVYSMDAGYNSYTHELEPLSIPICDLGPIDRPGRTGTDGGGNLPGRPPSVDGSKGRETLVPGFMAGIEAMHKRFGSMAFAELFEPAIWYAEHGIKINDHLAHYFKTRQKFLSRTAEGRVFMQQATSNPPALGENFAQTPLVSTLRAVAKQGSSYMYSGEWGRHFVAAIQKEGGKVCNEDLANYKVIWSEPKSTSYLGNEVFIAGLPNQAAYHILTGLNLAEVFKLEEHDVYWRDAKSLCDLQKIADITEGAPALDAQFANYLKTNGVDTSPPSQLTKKYAEQVAPLLDSFVSAQCHQKADTHHSNSIVVVDKSGNIAAVTHTINSVMWGDTGIFVDGIAIPDSAGFQQARLATIKPGERLPNETVQTIVFKNNQPILATSAIGASMIPETLKILVGRLGNKTDLATLQLAPPILYNFMLAKPETSAATRGMAVAGDVYAPAILESLKTTKTNFSIIPAAIAQGLRGTVTAVDIDPTTRQKRTAETPKMLIFGAAN